MRYSISLGDIDLIKSPEEIMKDLYQKVIPSLKNGWEVTLRPPLCGLARYALVDASIDVNDIKKPAPERPTPPYKFNFIDLFAGIGGFHLALKNLGGECIFACEIDKHARETYKNNHEFLPGLPAHYESFPTDIRMVDAFAVPSTNILCAGFPCQPFSQAGFKNGFDDTRGTLFFEILRFISLSTPDVIFLENVPHLLKHNDGKTFEIIKDAIDEIGYSFYYKVMRASDFGLPQHRPRLIMVGFRYGRGAPFTFPEPVPLKLTMSDILGGECPKKIGYTLRVGGRGSKINDRRNWDSYLVDGKVKRLTPAHALKMQGFPDDFRLPVSETQAMKQLGNSVAVPVIQAVGKQILKYLEEN